MIAAAAASCDALDGDGQIAIALRDHGRQLVDLLGRFRRRLDFDPAADAVEDGFGIEGIGCRQHDVACDCHSGMGRLARARNLEIANEIPGSPPSRLLPTWIVILPNSVNPGSLASLAPRKDDVLSALVRFFASSNLFDQIDNAAPEFAVGNARERAG